MYLLCKRKVSFWDRNSDPGPNTTSRWPSRGNSVPNCYISSSSKAIRQGRTGSVIVLGDQLVNTLTEQKQQSPVILV
jgi:hypothetical protein